MKSIWQFAAFGIMLTQQFTNQLLVTRIYTVHTCTRSRTMDVWYSSTKQYRCDYPGCTRGYYERSNLTRHKRNKHGLKPRRFSLNVSAISVVHQSHDDSLPGQISLYQPSLEQLALDHDLTVPQQLNKDMYAPQQLPLEKDQLVR